MSGTTTAAEAAAESQAANPTVIQRRTTSVMVDGRNGKMPWSRRKVALLAALPLMGGLTAIATPWAVDHIEDELTSDTVADLAAAGIDADGLDIDFDYRDGEVRGILPLGATAGDVTAAVDDALLRDLDVLATVPEPAAPVEAEPTVAPVVQTGPTEVSVELTDGVMTLRGTVLTDDQRTALVGAAADAVGAENVRDELEVSGLAAAVDGADARVADLSSVLASVAGADSATIGLTDTDLSVIAIAATPEVAQTIEAAADASSVTATAEVDVVPTNADQAVTASLLNGGITLSGMVPTDADRARLIDAAAAVVGAENVLDELVVTGLPSGVDGAQARLDGVVDVLGAFGPNDTGDIVMTDTSFSLTAAVDATADDLAALEALVAAIPADDTATELSSTVSETDIQVDALTTELDALQAEILENVVFETATAVLDTRAQATLDRVAAAMNRHPLPVVAIVGHTDSVGSAEGNRSLSAARAAAVVRYLETAGVDADRLRATGAGESDPIATNDTAEGRAENRRVEITALASF